MPVIDIKSTGQSQAPPGKCWKPSTLAARLQTKIGCGAGNAGLRSSDEVLRSASDLQNCHHQSSGDVAARSDRAYCILSLLREREMLRAHTSIDATVECSPAASQIAAELLEEVLDIIER